MALVLELSAGHLARSRWQVQRQSLQRLNVGQLVGTHRALPSVAALTSRAIHRAHVSDFRLAVGVAVPGEPGSNAVWLQVGRFWATARVAR